MRFKITNKRIVRLIVALYCLTGIFAPQCMVVCIGSDDHIAVEPPHKQTGYFHSSNRDDACNRNSSEIALHNPQATPCKDIPLLSGIASPARAEERSLNGAENELGKTASPDFTISIASMLSKADRFERPYSPPLTIPPDRHFLKTTILLL